MAPMAITPPPQHFQALNASIANMVIYNREIPKWRGRIVTIPKSIAKPIVNIKIITTTNAMAKTNVASHKTSIKSLKFQPNSLFTFNATGIVMIVTHHTKGQQVPFPALEQ